MASGAPGAALGPQRATGHIYIPSEARQTAAAASTGRIHDYVVNGKGSAKEALDKIIEDWEEVFEADGKI